MPVSHRVSIYTLSRPGMTWLPLPPDMSRRQASIGDVLSLVLAACPYRQTVRVSGIKQAVCP